MITLTELKKILKISGTGEDEILQMLIPLIIDSICTHCRNFFIDEDLHIRTSATIDNTSNTVTLSDFDDEFIAGDYIRIFNTGRNNGHALITAIDGNVLTLEQIDLVSEEASDIIIFRAIYPKVLKLTIANIIRFELSENLAGVKREKIDDYEVEFFSSNLLNGVPEQFLTGLSRYKKFYWDDINI